MSLTVPRRPALALLVLAALAVAAVLALRGGAPANAAGALHLRADPHGKLRFNTKTLHAHHGRVTIVMANPRSSGQLHAIAIAGHGSGRDVTAGHTSTVTANLKPGTYTFFCPVPGHRAGGMQGKLIVK